MNILRSLRPRGGARGNLRIAFTAALALVVLNIGLAHQNIWPTLFIRATTELSLELIVLVTALVLAAACGLRLKSRALWALSALLLVLVAARYVDVMAPALFGRRIDLYWDTQHLPAVIGMMLESWPPLSVAALLAALAAGFAFALIGLRLALGAVWRAAQQPFLRKALGGGAASLLAVYVAGMSSDALDWERRFAIPITPVYFDQAKTLAAHFGGTMEVPELATPLRPYAELNGRDVYVLFLESYGRIALDGETYSSATRHALAEMETRLSSTGWSSRSAYLSPPTFGGASWLSHASFLSGNKIDSHDLYQAFLHSRNERLTDRLRRAGYRSVLLTPGIRGPWPAGLALGFDHIVPAKEVGYRGPGFGWWFIPDQYSLDWIYRSEIAREARQPLFIMFPTIMSHFPFGPAPPYAEEWSALAAGNPFDEAAVADALALGDAISGDPEPAYLRVMLYNLKTLGGFVERRAPENAIIVAIGDHQPPSAISGQDAEWDIPVHVFARDEALLDVFDRAGFVKGTLPEGASVARVDEMTALVLEALEEKAPASQVVGID